MWHYTHISPTDTQYSESKAEFHHRHGGYEWEHPKRHKNRANYIRKRQGKPANDKEHQQTTRKRQENHANDKENQQTKRHIIGLNEDTEPGIHTTERHRSDQRQSH